MRNFFSLLACSILMLLAGCASTPSTRIKEPITARPIEQKIAAAPNGAIFQAGQNERPLFEDRRARNVGDILTIVISESTSASEKNSSNAEHSGTLSMTTPTITGNLHGMSPTASTAQAGATTAPPLLGSLGVSAESSGKLAKKGDTAGSNVFTGTISVTVIDVLPNGNLLVGGEKQVSISHSDEFIRFSGVVNPATITGSNTVQSTQVADVHLEYKGTSSVDSATIISMFGRMFLSLVPF